MAADPPDPPRRHFNLKPKEDFARANAPDVAQHNSADHDVYAWRQESRAIDRKAEAHHDNLPVPPPQPNRRRRDYILLKALDNSLFGGLTWLGLGNPFLLVFARAGLIIFNLGLTWLRWVVMDRY